MKKKQNKTQLKYFDARAGGGKTTCLAQVALRYAAMGRKVIISQISCPLIEATFREHFAPDVIDERYKHIPITRIHSADGSDGKNVTSRLIEHTKEPRIGGEIVMCTHAGHLGMQFFAGRKRWYLIVDETPCPSRAYTLKLTDNHKTITDHVDAIPCAIPGYVELVAKEKKTGLRKIVKNKKSDDDLRRIAENELQDEMYNVIQGLAKDILNPNVRCYAFAKKYDALLAGEQDKESTKLHVFTELSPAIYDGYAEVTIISALFRSTMLYQSWNVNNALWSPVDDTRWNVKYPEHENGHLLTIYYANTRDFAKYQRDQKMLDANGHESDVTYMQNVMTRVEDLFALEPFLYSINKDMIAEESEIAMSEYIRSGTRLSGSPHGINQYRGWHNVAILCALNPTLQHLHFHAARGIDAQAVKNAQYRQACYQILCRCSLRDAANTDRKKCVVMDKQTAEFIAAMFPGCAVLPLPESKRIGTEAVLMPYKAKGRTKKHESSADRLRHFRAKKAWRKSRKLELLAQIDSLQVNHTEFSDRNGQLLNHSNQQSETLPLEKKENQRNTNPIKVKRFTSSVSIDFPLFAHKRTHLQLALQSWSENFMPWLESLHTRVVGNKDDNQLVATSTFEHIAECPTEVGRENVTATVGIWWDQDGATDLSAEEFASWFPDIEMYIYATHSSTRAEPRWRAYMPTDLAMPGKDSTRDLYWVIMRRLVEIVNEHGYWSQAEIDKGIAPKDAKRHGFDSIVWRPEAKIYLPCVPFDPEGAISIMLDGEGREPIILRDWIETRIDSILDKETPEKGKDRSASSAATAMATKCTNGASELPSPFDETSYIDRAESAYDDRPSGKGHVSFYSYAYKLASTSLDDYEIRTKLENAAWRSGRSAKRRYGEINDIMCKLDRSHKLGNAHE